MIKCASSKQRVEVDFIFFFNKKACFHLLLFFTICNKEFLYEKHRSCSKICWECRMRYNTSYIRKFMLLIMLLSTFSYFFPRIFCLVEKNIAKCKTQFIIFYLWIYMLSELLHAFTLLHACFLAEFFMRYGRFQNEK